MRKITLFRIDFGQLIIEAVKKSKKLTDAEKDEIIDHYNSREEKFIVDPQWRDSTRTKDSDG